MIRRDASMVVHGFCKKSLEALESVCHNPFRFHFYKGVSKNQLSGAKHRMANTPAPSQCQGTLSNAFICQHHVTCTCDVWNVTCKMYLSTKIANTKGMDVTDRLLCYTLFFIRTRKIWLSLRMFLFQPIHFLKFWGKSQPQRSYKNGSYKEKRVYSS